MTRGKTVARIAGTAAFSNEQESGLGTIRAVRRRVRRRIWERWTVEVICIDRSIAY